MLSKAKHLWSLVRSDSREEELRFFASLRMTTGGKAHEKNRVPKLSG